MKNLCVWLFSPKGGQEGATGNPPAQLSSTIVVVVLSTEALLRQGVSETGSAAGRKAVNEPMEEAFISWVYREGGDIARKTLQSGMVTWAFLLAEI